MYLLEAVYCLFVPKIAAFIFISFVAREDLTYLFRSEIGRWQGLGPYSASIKKVEKEIKEMAKKINDLCGE